MLMNPLRACMTAIWLLIGLPLALAQEAPKAALEPGGEGPALSVMDSILQKVQQDIETAKQSYRREAQRRQAVEHEAKRLRMEQELGHQENEKLKREQEWLQTRLHDLEQQRHVAQEEIEAGLEALREANARITGLTTEKQHLVSVLTETRKQMQDVERKLALEQKAATLARQAREGSLRTLEAELARLQQENTVLTNERRGLDATLGDLHQQVEDVESRLAERQQELHAVSRELAAVRQDKEQLTVAFEQANKQLSDLGQRLTAEQTRAAEAEKHEQAALTAAANAQEEAARQLSKQAAQIEMQLARLTEIEKQLSDRDHEIGGLHLDREMLSARVAQLSTALEEAQSRLSGLNDELSAAVTRAMLAEEERDQLLAYTNEQRALLNQRAGQSVQLTGWRPRDTSGEGETHRPEGAVKFTKWGMLLESVSKAVEGPITAGEASVIQAGDQVKITLLDQLLFHPAQAKLKPEAVALFKRLNDVLKPWKEIEIHVAGHSDNIPIGQKLRSQFSSNWELSAARATAVVRYFIEEGGIDAERISAGGYAHTRPVASNNTAEGRALNRRLELTLTAKETTVVAQQPTR